MYKLKYLNRNTLWAEIFVNSLANVGLDAVCISPGSRSTPLAMAFANQSEIEVFSLLDERGAGYFVLGMALEKGKAVALVCTSGTAVANYFPAVIEANYSNVPLLLLTADRPHELRNSGTNQSIDQIKIFGDHVREFIDLALPEANPTPKMMRYLQSTAARVLFEANSFRPGPVHINMPFRKPLEPNLVPEDFSEVWHEKNDLLILEIIQSKVSISIGQMMPTEEQIQLLAGLISEKKKGLIICGPKSPEGEFPAYISELARISKYPILADGLSGLRFNLENQPKLNISGYESFLASDLSKDLENPEIILQFGNAPISNRLQNFLAGLEKTRRIQINSFGNWADGEHRLTDHIWADPIELCRQVIETLDPWERDENNWIKSWINIEKLSWEIIESYIKKEWFEGAVLSEILKMIPEESNLFVASSLPIRHLDQFGKSSQKKIRIFANRGASGIDGTISSALGVVAASKKLIVLLIGDLSFYHDLNALLSVRRHDLQIIIVLINNDGGGIFHRLPIADFNPPFNDLFLTPHGLSFEKTAQQFSLEYSLVNQREGFGEAFQKSIKDKESTIIEVVGDSVKHESSRKEIVRLLNQAARDQS